MKNYLLILIAALCAIQSLLAQPGANDPTFNPGDVGFGNGDGSDFVIYTTAIQSDGKILIGGFYTKYNGQTRNYIARLNSDGSLDATFNPSTGANDAVHAIALLSDGKILICGNFTAFNGNSINRIARLNSDGSLDVTFTPGSGANNLINSMVLQSDGKILIGGNFTSFNGTTINRIARLNSDGSLDAAFTPGTGANNTIYSIALQSDGKIVIGGDFTSYNSSAMSRIARLNIDGSLDITFVPGTGANNTVQKIAIQNDGKILISGAFTAFNGLAINRIARLNSVGGLDGLFSPGTGANSLIRTIAIQSDNKILIGGDFTNYNGSAMNRIARLNSDGSIDVSFLIGTGADNYINHIAIQTNGKILIVGVFYGYNDITRKTITRLNIDGSMELTFNSTTGLNGLVFSIALQSDGKILIGGNFTNYNGSIINRIARLNSDGIIDATFNPGSGANNTVQITAIQSDGKILIGGEFTSCNGSASSRIARLNFDGSLDATFNPGTGANSTVQTIALQSDGKILIGGSFTTYNGTTINRIARLNSDGSLDASFNPGSGANSNVSYILTQSNGKILIGGNFTSYNGTAISRIARLNSDGSLDATFNSGTGANNTVQTIALQSDGKIMIGGDFNMYNGSARSRIARLNSDGSLDATFIPGTGVNTTVKSIVVQVDGKILIGGTFTNFDGTTINRIARLNSNGSLDATFTPGTGANNSINSMVIQTDGKILIGGVFTGYNGTGRNRIARILIDTPLPVTWLSVFAKKQNSKHIITWMVSTEQELLGYDVETSEDGFNFQKIGEVRAYKNEGISKTYQFENSIYRYGEITYYRIKQKDSDGSFSYSEVVVVQDAISPLEAEVSLYPNPTIGELYIQAEGIIEIYSIDGLLKLREEVHHHSIDISNFLPGTYRVVFRSENIHYSEFIIIKL